MATYLIDTNCLITAHRATYPFDVVPGFWTKIKALADAGSIVSIDKVKAEIYKNEDLLKQWCNANLSSGFFHDSSTISVEYGQVVTWAATCGRFNQPAIADFLAASRADAWLVAYAKAKGMAVTTLEVSDPNIKRAVKIPDACDQFNVPFVNIIGMFRELGTGF